MENTYTYKPSEIAGETVSHARFVLGDTMVNGKEATSMLCDEEYDAIIKDSRNWKVALYRLCDAICMKLQYETDWRDDGAAFSLNQRAERFLKLRDKLKADADAVLAVPTSGAVRDSVMNPTDSGHYFRAGMMRSPNVQPPSPYGGDD